MSSINDIPDEYLACRDLGHAFQPWDVRRFRQEYERVLRCSRCSTFKTQVLDRRGYIQRSWYQYPEQQMENGHAAYVLKGIGRMTVDMRAEIRVMSSEQMRKTGS